MCKREVGKRDHGVAALPLGDSRRCWGLRSSSDAVHRPANSLAAVLWPGCIGDARRQSARWARSAGGDLRTKDAPLDALAAVWRPPLLQVLSVPHAEQRATRSTPLSPFTNRPTLMKHVRLVLWSPEENGLPYVPVQVSIKSCFLCLIGVWWHTEVFSRIWTVDVTTNYNYAVSGLSPSTVFSLEAPG